ncbi:MAG: hypothetical protein IT375_17230 [Polyangiaceae bacterium]|nr:hypothetical protein [Polyangiaceae bacterium]
MRCEVHFICLSLVLAVGCGADEACREENEDMVSSAAHVGDLDDDRKRSLRLSGTLSNCNETAYLHYYAEDTGFVRPNRPTLEVNFEAPVSTGESNEDTGSSTLLPEACVYVACWYGATELALCRIDGQSYAPVTTPDGFRGCCHVGSAKIELDYECDNALVSAVSDDDAEFFVHLCTNQRPQRAVVSYDLAATF